MKLRFTIFLAVVACICTAFIACTGNGDNTDNTGSDDSGGDIIYGTNGPFYFTTVSDYRKSDDESLTFTAQEGSATAYGVKIDITNNTEESFIYDMHYTIERETDGVWYTGKGNYYFKEIGAIISANDTNVFTVTLDSPLEDGHYRILKDFTLSSGTVTYDAEFEVSG